MGSFSLFHWLIVLAVVVLIFGTKKLPAIGRDLGGAIRSFKEGTKSEAERDDSQTDHRVIDNKTDKNG